MAWLVRHALEQLGGCGLDFRRRHVMQTSCDSPFVTEGISHTSESFTPEYIGWLHDHFRTVTLHVRYHRVTIIHLDVDCHRRRTQRHWTGRTTVLG